MSTYGAFASLLKSICSRNGVPLSAPALSALDRLMLELEEAEQAGSLCLEWSEDDPDVAALLSTPLACEHPEPTNPCPLVVDKKGGVARIYSRREFANESLIAKVVSALAAQKLVKSPAQQHKLSEFSLRTEQKSIQMSDEQLQAIYRSLNARFAVISGGPGTGKTTTVVKLLEVLLAEQPEASIAFCAPTGKATSRLNESIRHSISREKNAYPLVLAALDSGRIEGKTIHKLLATKTRRGNLPSEQNKLDCDILVIDEASMIDSGIAVRLLRAIDPDKTRLILLGDKHQLAAVGPGSVFGDLSDSEGPLGPHISLLNESHRFGQASPIGRLARAVNAQGLNASQDQTIKALLAEPEVQKTVRFVEAVPKSGKPLTSEAKQWLKNHLQPYIEAVSSGLPTNPSEAQLTAVWDTLSKFRALSATNRGPMSVFEINKYCDGLMQSVFAADPTELYNGKVIIIRKNDAALGVSNGDMAVIYQTQADPEAPARFDAWIGDLKKSIPARLLPRFETAYAITIHQSQGSDADDIAVFLPIEGTHGQSLATRELLYTGITRAKKTCVIFGSEKMLLKAAATPTVRTGGLRDRLAEFA